MKQEFIDQAEATPIGLTQIGRQLADIVKKASGKEAQKRAENVQIPNELMGDPFFFGA